MDTETRNAIEEYRAAVRAVAEAREKLRLLAERLRSRLSAVEAEVPEVAT